MLTQANPYGLHSLSWRGLDQDLNYSFVFFHGVLCSNKQTIYSLGVPEMIFCGWNPERIYQHLKQEYKRRQPEKSVETGMLWSVLDLSYPNLLGACTLWECPSALAAAGGKWRGKALNDGAGWMLSSHI